MSTAQPTRRARRSRSPLLLQLTAMLSACESPAELASPSSASAPPTRHIDTRDARRSIAHEPPSKRSTRPGNAVILIDLTHGPRRHPAQTNLLPEVLVYRDFMQVDEQSYWLQPWLGDPVIRVPRDRDTRWVRDGYPCPGWLFGERDDQLYCAEELADEQLEITAVDKSGSSAPSRVAHLPNDNGGRFGRHMSTAHQGPLLVGERVLQAIATGFVSAELDGDGSLEFIELGYRPACAVARGEHVAWLAVEDGHALFSGEYPLSAIHHEYGRAPWLGLPHANEPERRLACPAWAGESLLLPVHKGETMDLLRLNEHQQFTLVEGIALDLNELFGDGDLAWWYVRGQGLWWIDATSHGPVDAGDLFAAELTASGGALAWMNNAHAGCGVHVSDAYAGPTAWR